MSHPLTKKVSCPYVLGATFSLEITPPQGGSALAEAKVVHIYAPITVSPVVRVALSTQSTGTMLPGEAVLKIYDPRFAHEIRDNYDVDPPTYEAEVRYRDYLRSGNIAQTGDQIDDLAEGLPLDAPERIELGERFIDILMKELFENETNTYRVLSSMQGKYIPTFYGTTRLLDGSPPGIDTTVLSLLIEYIPGTSLYEIDPTIIDLDTVCSTGVDIVNIYSNLNVLNNDVRLVNFIVKPSGSEIVMIDLANCRMRREDEDDETWKAAKWDEDEEGCVGMVARNKFGWNYVRSGRYQILPDTEGPLA
ncbi:Pc15g00190 [Rhizoctonia solani]|uniref:Pc15g00190 n=1 Tax=Rhizoctonia solani TaxID=456999 RepID=A0A0K6FRZ6_9AGAM|nr:Pc15g00190 [Rhizoctonia solani]